MPGGEAGINSFMDLIEDRPGYCDPGEVDWEKHSRPSQHRAHWEDVVVVPPDGLTGAVARRCSLDIYPGDWQSENH